jgi:hypothetical protein
MKHLVDRTCEEGSGEQNDEGYGFSIKFILLEKTDKRLLKFTRIDSLNFRKQEDKIRCINSIVQALQPYYH